MLGILIVGLGLLTWLLIWLKRRHRRKVDERRAAMSGFPTEPEKRAGARSATPDLWGPHQVFQSISYFHTPLTTFQSIWNRPVDTSIKMDNTWPEVEFLRHLLATERREDQDDRDRKIERKWAR